MKPCSSTPLTPLTPAFGTELSCSIEEHQCDDKGKKVFVCHESAPGSFHTLCVSINAGGHADSRCGPCEDNPTTLDPTPAPSSTDHPTIAPTTNAPTELPTKAPTDSPTQTPTKAPTDAPTKAPTKSPTDPPTQSPTQTPTKSPTDNPTQNPTQSPTKDPTRSPNLPDLADLFIEHSVLFDLEPEIGTEVEENYTIVYNLTYLETGLVGLAASVDLIESVTCSQDGAVDIRFIRAPDPDKLDMMFPESGLLVVDGSVLGYCDVGTTIPSDVQIEGAGFLSIESVEQNGATVSLSLDLASFLACYCPGAQMIYCTASIYLVGNCGGTSSYL